MIVTTLRDAMEMLDPESDEGEQYIYFYHEGKTIFYIGKSRQPFERLQEHLGQGDDKRSSPFPDLIGRLILDNRPCSLEWSVTIMSLSELYVAMKLSMELNIDTIEMRLIAHYKPCLNRICNRHPTPLPERYRRQEISNKNIKL